MDKHGTIKRRAQDLVKKGSFSEAAEIYAQLADAESMQPYDFVVLGDLLIRAGNRNDALARYKEALDSYAESGLNRNAIALAKKIHRLAPKLHYVHRKLGELYAAEDLASEACLHFMTFLERADREAEEMAEAVGDVCTRLLELSLPSFDMVDRVVEIGGEFGIDAPLAAGVMKQAGRAGATGQAETESRLTRLARSLDADVEVAATESGEAPAAVTEEFLDPGAMYLEEASAAEPVEVIEEAPPQEVPTLSLDEFSLDEEESISESEAVSGPADGVPGSPVVLGSARSTVAASEEAPAEDAEEVADDPAEDPDELRTRALEYLDRNESILAQRELVKAAAAYFRQGRSGEAEDLYRRVVQLDPNHLEALRGLVELAHINGEKGKMAHWGCELGDVLLAREMYADAKLQFERVLAFDPENAKAQSRINRLKTMGAVDGVSFGELAPDVSEVEGAKVTVLNEADGATQSELDLTQILDEFRSEVVEQISGDDTRSHYDLGMTYKEMGLLDEAVEEFRVASDSIEDRSRSLEMLGECYLLLERFEEALRVLKDLLPLVEGESLARLHLQMGRAWEGMGEWDKAEEEYFRALELNEDLTEAMRFLEDLEHRRERGAA